MTSRRCRAATLLYAQCGADGAARGSNIHSTYPKYGSHTWKPEQTCKGMIVWTIVPSRYQVFIISLKVATTFRHLEGLNLPPQPACSASRGTWDACILLLWSCQGSIGQRQAAQASSSHLVVLTDPWVVLTVTGAPPHILHEYTCRQ